MPTNNIHLRNAKVCSELYNILLTVSLQRLYYFIEAAQTIENVPDVVEVTCVGSWRADTLSIFHFLCDLKDAQINVWRSQIRELMLYEFEFAHNFVEVTENICCVKREGVADHIRVTRWLKNFPLVARNSSEAML